MATKFSTFFKELKKEAEPEGPEAVAELRYFRESFGWRRFAEARRKRA